MKTCSVDDCAKPHHAHGYCSTHAARWKKNGDPLIVGDHYPGRPKLERPGYDAAHRRVSRSRGRAALYACVDCGGPAGEWSYDGGSDSEIVGDYGGSTLAWSPLIEDYSPRCRPCHRRCDASLIRNRDELGRWSA